MLDGIPLIVWAANQKEDQTANLLPTNGNSVYIAERQSNECQSSGE